MSQPTGNFPLYLVMSRIKELESIMASQRADSAERQMSNQAGSVYERMLQGQQDTGMGLNAGMPNVMSEVAATPDAATQGMTPPEVTQGLEKVAAHGGYARDLPTIEMKDGTGRIRRAMDWASTPWPQNQPTQILNRRNQLIEVDPLLRGEALGLGSIMALASALYGVSSKRDKAKEAVRAPHFMPRETEDMGQERRNIRDLEREREWDEIQEKHWTQAPHRLLKRLRGNTVEKAQGGIAGLPTVRMQGDPRDYMPMTERDIVRVAGKAKAEGMPTGGSFEEGTPMRGYNATRQGLAALMAARARRARELAALGMPLVGSYGSTSPYGTGSGFVKSYGETAVASNGGYARDLPTVRMQGMEHYPDRDPEYLPEGPDLGWARKGAGWIWDKAGDFFEAHQPTDNGEGNLGELRTHQTVVQPSHQDADNLIARQVGGLERNFTSPSRYDPDNIGVNPGISIDEFTAPLPPVEVQVPPVPEPLPPSRIVVDNAEIDSASEERKKLDAAVEQQGNTFSALENIQGMKTAEQIAEGKKDLITTLGVPATEYDTAVEGHVSNIKEASDTAISTIKEKMDAYTNFAKGGKLPEEVRGRFITDLLLLGSKALLGNPTWHQAGEQFVDDAMKVKKEYHEDWAKSLNVMLTNESNIQQMKMAATTAEETARISLARSKYEAATGAITAASQYEKDAYAANNERTRLELALSTANAQNITALATYVAATEGKPDPEERQIKNIIEARFRELNEAGDTLAMDKEFYSINGKYSASNIRIDKWVPIINEYRLTGQPSYAGRSFDRTNRDAYDAAVTIAKKAYGSVQGEKSFAKAPEAIDIVIAMGIDADDVNALEKIDKDAFIAAYIREMNPTQVQGEWAQFYMPEYGMTTGGWTAKLPPKNNGTE